MARKSTAFAEFVLSNEEELKSTILPLLEANKQLGIKTLIFKRDLEQNKVHVTCIGIKVPYLDPNRPEYELIALRPGQHIDLAAYARAEIDPVGLKFGTD